MTRVPCGSEEKADGLRKGPWTPDEDHKLLAYIQKHGHGSWRSLPLNAGLQRCGKSCRLRWTNYLRPDIKRGRFSHDEDQMIIHLHAILGNRWSAISSYLPRRTDNEIKNYWNTHLKKRLLQIGIDPVTHKSTVEEELLLDSIIPGLRPVVSSNLTHMSQWDSFRAEAEARLSRQSNTCSDFQQQQDFTNQGGSGLSSGSGSVAASTTFMSLWKAQVAETLRPSFGVVELDEPTTLINNHPFNFQTFLQDWESSLQRPPAFSTCDSPIAIPDLGSGTPSGTVSPQYRAQGPKPVFPTSEQITERLLATSPQCRNYNYFDLDQNNNMFPLDSDHSQSLSAAGSTSFSFTAICGDSSDQSQFSSTSTLRDYDSSSPCNSNLDVLVNAFHDGNSEQSQVHNLVFPLEPASFWSPKQQVVMSTDTGFSFGGAVPMLLNPVVGVPNNIPIPQFNSLM